MSFLLRRIQKRRQLHKEIKAEAERQIQREQRDHDQAQALGLTLRELRRTMDPLMAAQTYNNRFCPLSRLPEEILQCILDFIDHDVVTLWCLRIVSTVFRRLLHPREVIWNASRWCEDYCEDWRLEFEIPHALVFSAGRREFYQRLRRDKRCDNSRRLNDANRGLGSRQAQIPAV